MGVHACETFSKQASVYIVGSDTPADINQSTSNAVRMF